MVHVAIPSANRADKRARSVEQLAHLDKAHDDITWYVPPGQLTQYRRFLPYWHEVLPYGGLKKTALNNIMGDYVGDDVVLMDDDIPWFIGSKAVFKLRPGNSPRTPKLNVGEVARIGFDYLDQTGLRAWGVYPVPYSGTMLKPRVGVGKAFLTGAAVGLRIPSSGAGFKIDLQIKDDYEMTSHLIDRDGGIVRLDHICAYTVVGGAADNTMGGLRTVENEGDAATYLVSRWPSLWAHTAPRDGLPQVGMRAQVEWLSVVPEAGWVG